MEPLVPGCERPKPPIDMPAGEAEIWCSVVDSMPPGHFRQAMHGILRLYCAFEFGARTAVRDFLRLQATGNNREAERQAKLADRLASRAASLASKLRISPQSSKHRFSVEAAVRRTPMTRPWLDYDELPNGKFVLAAHLDETPSAHASVPRAG